MSADTFWQWSPRTEDLVEVDTSSRQFSRYWIAKTMQFPPPPEPLDKPIEVGGVVLRDRAASQVHAYLAHWKYSSELFKEHVFEIVRRDEFSDLPSRRSCMFLLDMSLDPIAYRNQLRLQHASLYEVKIKSGRWHRARTSLLNCNTRMHDVIVGRARFYWSPIDPDMDSEVLFEGTATLRRVAQHSLTSDAPLTTAGL